MNVQCASCNTQYQIDATKVPAGGGFIRCKTCGERVRIPPPPREAAAPIPLSGTADDDRTRTVTTAPADGATLGDTTAEAHEADTRVVPGPPVMPPGAIPEPGPEAPGERVSGPASSAIPLSSTPDDELETAAAGEPPAPSPLPASGLPGSSPAPAEPPDFLDDLPAAMPEQAPPPLEADDLPALDDLPAAPEKVASTPEERIPDLPASADAQEAETAVSEPDLSLFEDLPAADDDVAETKTVQIADTRQPLTDLPTIPSAEGGGAPALDLDSPPAATGSGGALEPSPAFDDLPTVDADAPRLMDEILTSDTGAPRLMDDDLQEGDTVPAVDSMAVDGAPAATTEAPGPVMATAAGEGQPAATPIARLAASRTRIVVLGAVLGVILLGGLGYFFRGLFVGDGEKPAQTNTPPQADATPPEVKPPDTQGPEVKTPEPPQTAPLAPPPALTSANVDSLPFAQLEAATAEASKAVAGDDVEGQALLAWARFRLATSFGDARAGKDLTARLRKPKEITRLGGMAAAAAIGALAYAGKGPVARKVGERLQRGRLKESPQLAMALATTFTRKAETPKAVRQLDRALRLAPGMGDAQLMRGRLLMQGRDVKEGVRSLVDLAATTDDIDMTLRAAEHLLAAGQLGSLDRALEPLEDASQTNDVPPSQRDTLLRLLVRKRVRRGDLAGAAEVAETRAEAAPTNASLCLERARLIATTGGDADAILEEALARVGSPRTKARLVAEQVRMALRRDAADEAKAALAAGRELIPGKEGATWLKLAEGWIAKQSGDLDAARAAFKAAGKGKEKLIEAKLAEALLAADKPGPLMKRLSELQKRHALPEASFHLAHIMRERGNTGGAVELYDRVLWSDPTAVDPVELLLEWADLLDATGKSSQAESVAKALYEARQEDPRPLRMLASISRRAGKWADAVEWTRVLTTTLPDDLEAAVEHADALIGAGKEREAQTLLAELFKQHPEARTPAAMVVQARAWMKREPFKAKEALKESALLEPKAEKYILLAKLEAGRGRNDAAKNAFSKAIELDPKAPGPQIAVARILIEERTVEDGAAILEKVLAKHPNDPEANELYGDALVDLGKSREAVNRYNKTLGIAGDKAPLLMKVARVQLQQLGQLGPAVRTLRRAIKTDPKYAEPHYYLGLALKDMDKKGEAKQALLSYVRLAPDGEFANDARRIVADLEKL